MYLLTVQLLNAFAATADFFSSSDEVCCLLTSNEVMSLEFLYVFHLNCIIYLYTKLLYYGGVHSSTVNPKSVLRESN